MDFEQTLKEFFDRGYALMLKKNHDYAGSKDPFANFKSTEVVGVSAERAILVRMMDKMSRAGRLLEREGQVLDESLEDTLLDIANYANLLHALIKDGKS